MSASEEVPIVGNLADSTKCQQDVKSGPGLQMMYQEILVESIVQHRMHAQVLTRRIIKYLAEKARNMGQRNTSKQNFGGEK